MSKSSLKKVLRTAQTYFPPFAVDLKYFAQDSCRKLARKPFEETFRFLSHFRPPPGSVFLDIGANRGQSIAAMRLFQPGMPIVAFEPAAATFARLRRMAGALPGVRLVEAGLSDAPGRMTLYTPVYRGFVFDGLASIVREEAEGWLRDRIYFYDPACLDIHEEEVTLSTLDSLGLTPSFVKLDVQGAEHRVLRGGLRTVTEAAPVILVEQSLDSTVESLLAPLGYAAYRYEAGRLCPGTTGGRDALFVPEARRGDFALPLD